MILNGFMPNQVNQVTALKKTKPMKAVDLWFTTKILQLAQNTKS